MARKPYGVIYLIINNINLKVYIGQTISDFDSRYKNNVEKYTHNEYLRRAIDKYGISNFTILKKFDKAFSQQELNELEKEWISYFGGVNSPSVYNMTDGGGNRKASEELKKKLSVSQNKRYSKMSPKERSVVFGKSMKGKSMSFEQREKISNSSKGKEVSMETKKKISNTLKGRKRTKESIDKQIVSRCKRVVLLNNNIVFQSIKEAEGETGISGSDISKCCKGKVKSAGKDKNGNKLIWEYYKEEM